MPVSSALSLGSDEFDLSADGHPLVKLFNLFVEQTDAAI
jgi:hypothetical protein